MLNLRNLKFGRCAPIWAGSVSIRSFSQSRIAFDAAKTNNDPYKVMVLGGHGVFGSQISQRLAKDANIQVIVARRTQEFAAQLNSDNTAGCNDKRNPVESVAVDVRDVNALHRCLQEKKPNLVIHTCGPFQGLVQNYNVAEACVASGVHYIDLADGREFVSNIGVLDQKAKQNNVVVLSGASSVPSISDRSVNAAMAPGARPCMSAFTNSDEVIDTLQREGYDVEQYEFSNSADTEKMAGMRIYPLALGPSILGQMSQFVRLFHSIRFINAYNRVRGRVAVIHHGLVGRVLAPLFRFPACTPAGQTIPLTVEVLVSPDGKEEHWIRRFGDDGTDNSKKNIKQFETKQYYDEKNKLLMECKGPLKFGFHLARFVDEDGKTIGFEHKFVRCWFMSVPIPRFISPMVGATTTVKRRSKPGEQQQQQEEEEGWNFDVRISLPLLGTIVQYKGSIDAFDDNRKQSTEDKEAMIARALSELKELEDQFSCTFNFIS